MMEEFEKIWQEHLQSGSEKIEEVFRTRISPETDLSKAILDSLRMLQANNSRQLELLGRRLHAEMAGHLAPHWTIYTALVPDNRKNIFSERGFHSMRDTASDLAVPENTAEVQGQPGRGLPADLARPMFLNVPYSEMQLYLRRPFKGRCGGFSFTWELEPDYAFVERERLPGDAAFLYHVSGPLVFSPWSRRAVRVRVPDLESLPENAPLEMHFEQEGLNEVLLRDMELMWNIGISRSERGPSRFKEPDREEIRFIHYYEDDSINPNTYILPDMAFCAHIGLESIEAVKKPDNISLFSDRPLANPHYRLEITDPVLEGLPKDSMIFSNQCNIDALLQRERLRTMGDVNYLLNAFCQNGFSAHPASSAKNAFRNLYAKNHRYAPMRGGAEELFQSQNPFKNYVRFDGPANFKSDFAEFVLNYLSFRHPEFQWWGVVAE